LKATIRTEADRQQVLRYVEGVNLKKSLIVSITAQKKKRSLPQNRLLHLWLKVISVDTGNSTEALYTYFCERYLPWNKELVFGEETRKGSGSSQLDTKEFTHFLDSIKLEMSEQGIHLPEPGELGFDDMYNQYGGRFE
jgi:hypothetical protein